MPIPVRATLARGWVASLIDAERHAAGRRAFTQLPRRDQQLLSRLFADPPKSYKEISTVLGIPVGAIGPTRARCLTRARRTPAIPALLLANRHDSHTSHNPQSHHIAV